MFPRVDTAQDDLRNRMANPTHVVQLDTTNGTDVNHVNPVVVNCAPDKSQSQGGDAKDRSCCACPLPAATPPPAGSLTQTNGVLTPTEAYQALIKTAEAKMGMPYLKLAVLGILAGFYISAGFMFCLGAINLMGNNFYGALTFPTGLLLITLCGAELFTGNTCCMFSALIESRANLWHNLKIMFSAYFWNVVGCLIIVGLNLGGGVWSGREDTVHAFAHKKVSLPWGEVVCRGILANWFVNLAIWQASCSRDVIGKAIGCWTPIAAFVCIGLEHAVANMFVIPMSIYLDPTAKYPNTITWRDFIALNLIPTTIGNWVGGAVFVGAFQALSYGTRIPAMKDKAWDATLGKFIPQLP